jgi:hypothetical protein
VFLLNRLDFSLLIRLLLVRTLIGIVARLITVVANKPFLIRPLSSLLPWAVSAPFALILRSSVT